MRNRIPWLSVLVFSGLALAGISRAQSGTLVNFETEDGVQIYGEYSGAPQQATPAPMVLLVHMNRSDHTSWKPLLDPLQKAGFAVLAIDLRGMGQSGTEEMRKRVADRDEALYREMWLDVRAAYDWLAQQPGVDRSRVALVGASVGCSVAFRYATKDRSVDAIVALSPGPKYLGIDSNADVAELKARRMLLLASKEELSATQSLARLTSGVTTAGVGSGHGTELLNPAVCKRITDFLKESLGGPAHDPVYASIERDIYHKKGSGWIPRIKATNLREFSSAQEAEARGLRRSKSSGPGDKGAKEDGEGGKKSKTGSPPRKPR